MEYTKSVVVLRQVESGYALDNKSVGGIARIDCDGGVNRLILSVINAKLKESGEYFIYLIDSALKPFSFSLGKRAQNLNLVLPSGNFLDGFCAGIVFIKDCIPEVVAFSKTEDINFDLLDFKKVVASECLKKKLETEKEAQKIKSEVDIIKDKKEAITLLDSQEIEIKQKYDDEAVATENYFDFSKIESVKENERGRLSNENGDAYTRCENKEKEIKEDDFCEQFKTEHFEREKFCKDNPYYDTAKKELDLLFSKFPEDNTLKNVFPLSKWVKINYSQDRFYVVGVIYEQQQIKYICYGVPGKYSPTPPKELDGYCAFIPLSVFDMMGEGFWIMFQDAITGECVHKPTA